MFILLVLHFYIDRSRPLSTPVIPKQISAVRPTRNQNIPPSGKRSPPAPPTEKQSPGNRSNRSSIETATPLAEASNKQFSSLKPSKHKKTPSPRVSDGAGRHIGKNKRDGAEVDNKPAKKKKKDNSEVQMQDCSTEVRHCLFTCSFTGTRFLVNLAIFSCMQKRLDFIISALCSQFSLREYNSNNGILILLTKFFLHIF